MVEGGLETMTDTKNEGKAKEAGDYRSCSEIARKKAVEWHAISCSVSANNDVNSKKCILYLNISMPD